MDMAAADVFVDGQPAPARSGREICETIIAAGLADGEPHDLWLGSLTGNGGFGRVMRLYWQALVRSGRRVEVEQADGSLAPLAAEE